MKKFLFILLSVLPGLLALGQGTTSYISVGNRPFHAQYSITPISDKKSPLNVDVTFRYDQSMEMVTLYMTFLSKEYSHVLIPIDEKYFMDNCGKEFKRRSLKHGKGKYNGITGSHSSISGLKKCGLYTINDTLIVQFRLKDENVDTFDIVINSIAPVIEKRFLGIGKKKFHCVFWGSSLKWKIAIQRDPCSMTKNLAMRKRVSDLRRNVQNLEHNLKIVKGEECQKCKKERIPRLTDSLQEIMNQQDKKHPCTTINEEIETIRKLIDQISEYVCPVDPPPYCTKEQAATHVKKISDAKREIVNLSNKYQNIKKANKNSKELEKIKADTEKLIAETDLYCKKNITPICKKRKDVQEAISGYESIRKLLELMK